MFEDQIRKYDTLVSQYKKIVSDKFCKQEFIEYNEILFSAYSCAIEGNSFSVDETRTPKEKLSLKCLRCLSISKHTNIF